MLNSPPTGDGTANTPPPLVQVTGIHELVQFNSANEAVKVVQVDFKVMGEYDLTETFPRANFNRNEVIAALTDIAGHVQAIVAMENTPATAGGVSADLAAQFPTG